VITCRDAVTRLWAYLDQNLGRLGEAELEDHLGLCRHCCGELEFAKQLRERLRRSGASSAMPADIRARLERRLKDLRGER
jgi:mycothiol system anti-sigma-R factor